VLHLFFLHPVEKTTMDSHVIKSIFVLENDAQHILLTAVRYIQMGFLIMHMVFYFDRLLHIFCRVCLPNTVHPKISDVLPSPACEPDYPLVAIQLPMMDEIECCESAIECACNLDWPKSRLVVQVLDDSTNKQTKIVINNCAKKWYERGVKINVYRRQNRHGFKAGSLNLGMSFLGHVEYVGIFDVDFLPTKDYLLKTIPVLIQDPTVAFVQARWTFTNCKETLLTRMQEISLNFHHKCEQEGRFRASLFFSFNGTGGVWRASAINKIGGWHTDTLVEDLDLSLRAYLNGWRAVYMHDVECLNELPPTQSAYFTQQHRWTSGPIQVGKKMVAVIFQSKHVSWYKKLYCLWHLLRTCATLNTFVTLMVIMPINIWIPEMDSYNVVNIFLSTIMSFCNMAFTSDETRVILIHTLFFNAISVNLASATISGLFNCGSAKQWIVTPKGGSRSSEISSTSTSIEKNILCALDEKSINQAYHHRSLSTIQFINNHCRWAYQRVRQNFRIFRFYKRNFLMAVYLLVISHLALEKRMYLTALYMFSTSVMCFIVAFGCIGRQTEQSPHVL
jgi:cellulose synthase/poly-beta-1,6-N-acetylglucosamine synthase-like glycosyltransferase